MFLTVEEIRELTGSSRLREQTAWLDSNAFPYEVGGDRVPKVLREYVARRFGAADMKQDRRPQLRLPA